LIAIVDSKLPSPQDAHQPERTVSLDRPPTDRVVALGETLIVIDSDRPYRRYLVEAFRQREIFALGACDYDGAMAECRRRPIDWALVSLELDGRNGFFVVRDLREHIPSIRILLYSFAPCRSVVRDAVRLGALDCITRTDDVDAILACMREATAPVLEPPARPRRPESLADVIREHIEVTLRRCDGNVKLAAENLNVSRQTIYRWRRRELGRASAYADELSESDP
jgi:ActR/RegA family two-component response regulator